MENNSFTQTLSRAYSYKLLSECFYKPELNNFQELKKEYGEVQDESIEEIIFRLPLEESCFEELKVEHSKLFVGPFKLFAPPYG